MIILMKNTIIRRKNIRQDSRTEVGKCMCRFKKFIIGENKKKVNLNSIKSCIVNILTWTDRTQQKRHVFSSAVFSVLII